MDGMSQDVLLVADDPQGLGSSRTLLPELGLRPRVAVGGHAGLEAIRVLRPAFVVLDHWRAGLDPIGFLKLVSIEFPDLLDDIVVVSPTGTGELRDLLAEAGAGIVVDGSRGDSQLLSVLRRLAPREPAAARAFAPFDSQLMPVQVRDRFDPRGLKRGAVIADRYRIREKLGSGSMATVYAARDEHLEETVALKVLHAMQVTDAVRRFRRETRLARDIVHPNVVRTYEAGMWKGHPYLTMQLLQGVPLGRALVDHPAFTLETALRVGAAVAAGLGAIHAAGIDHRDLSAANVFLLDDERVATILDFGAARLPSDSMGVVSGGYVIGTPAILPPERILGAEGELGKADAWALGVLLYRMLTGRGPFDAAEPHEMLSFITDEPARPPSTVRPDTPLALSQLVMRLLDKEPASRASVGEAERALGKALEP